MKLEAVKLFSVRAVRLGRPPEPDPLDAPTPNWLLAIEANPVV